MRLTSGKSIDCRVYAEAIWGQSVLPQKHSTLIPVRAQTLMDRSKETPAQSIQCTTSPFKLN